MSADSPAKKLPFLPGYNIPVTQKTHHPKKHIFDVQAGLRADKSVDALDAKLNSTSLGSGISQGAPFAATVSAQELAETRKRALAPTLKSGKLGATAGADDEQKEENGGASRSGSALEKSQAELSATLGMSKLPQWLAFDRKVLRYYAFFKEAIHSSQLENERVRRCVLYVYLEDGSIHIAEPRQENSGLPQGVFVKRHKIPKPNGGFFGVADLVVGAELAIYGRTFRIVDADQFTRDYLSSQGQPMGEAEEYPDDQFTKKQAVKPEHFRKVMHPFKLYMEASKGKPMVHVSATRQFLEHDGVVLRFYCTWDDDNLYGEKRPYVLHYFVADDTVEVVEVAQPNSGRDAFCALLKRQRLPKDPMAIRADVARIGHATEAARSGEIDYYKAPDFKVGETINVFGRELVLCGCDKFTQKYYVDKFGADPNDYHELEEEEEKDEAPRMEPPPHNGIGSEEDSLNSFLFLLPKAPKSDFKKLMQLDGINLRYLAKLAQPAKEDRARAFIVTYYMNNDTLSVYERFERNSGFVGGKFYERTRTKNPATGEYFKATDLFVGAEVEINHYRFVIVEGDTYTLSYMQEHFGTDKWNTPNSSNTAAQSSSSAK